VFTYLAQARAQVDQINTALEALATLIHRMPPEAREVLLPEVEDSGDRYEPSEAWFWRAVGVSRCWPDALNKSINAYERTLDD
jgi:hypothetical protein